MQIGLPYFRKLDFTKILSYIIKCMYQCTVVLKCVHLNQHPYALMKIEPCDQLRKLSDVLLQFVLLCPQRQSLLLISKPINCIEAVIFTPNRSDLLLPGWSVDHTLPLFKVEKGIWGRALTGFQPHGSPGLASLCWKQMRQSELHSSVYEWFSKLLVSKLQIKI